MQLTAQVHKGHLERPHATATVCGTRRHTWTVFHDRVARLAGVLLDLGVRPGDRVSMLALNSDRYLEFLYATWWIGGVVNPVNTRWSDAEIAFAQDDCNSRLLLTDRHFAAAALRLAAASSALQHLLHFDDGPCPAGLLDAEALLAARAPVADLQVRGDALAAVMYTGGTTGKPKGVMLSHANLVSCALGASLAIRRQVHPIGLSIAPMFHVGGLSFTLQLMLSLGTHVILQAFDERAVFDAIQTERCTESFFVPTMIKRLVEHPDRGGFDLRSLQLIIYGAAPIDAALLSQAITAWPTAAFCQAYGMTEFGPVITVLPPDDHRPGAPLERLASAGRPLATVQVRIVDPDGSPLPAGQVGEIVARGPSMMQGYWSRPQQTAEALRDGWLHTGDAGRLDADGYLYVVDRIKDMIISGGENVYSVEVENVIALHPAVSMNAVIGLPDPDWGERVHAVVVLRPGHHLDAAALTAFCRAHIAGYKCPRSVSFVDELPLSAAGKLLKHRLRDAATTP